mmetsp:Transcript_50372/g.142015  ORF Transcript_50372/g.142015 Transcript_50372/m.142015 type:complete len:528 (-) Transcript_50372:103-1686(-)
MPWHLCMLTAHASSNGSCTRTPRTKEPHLASKAHGGTGISRFTAPPKATTGCRRWPAPTKPTTRPWVPFTSLRLTSMVRVRTTNAPSLKSITLLAPVRWSSSSGLPSSRASNLARGPGSASRALAFTRSTSARRGSRRVVAAPWLLTAATRHGRSSCRDFSDRLPKRTSSRRPQNSASPSCLKTFLSSNIRVTARHAPTWKQSVAEDPGSPSCSRRTGGSWRKSPASTSCRPPNGLSDPRTAQAKASSLLKSSPSSIEISSMTSVLVSRHRDSADRFPCSSRANVATSASPRPMPAHLCTVVPPRWLAASAVGAVTAVPAGSRALSSWWRRKDLPVPAPPVKKRLSPLSAASQIARCSPVRRAASPAGSRPRRSAPGSASALLRRRLRRCRLESTPSRYLYFSSAALEARRWMPSVAARIWEKSWHTGSLGPLRRSWVFFFLERTPSRPWTTRLWWSVHPSSDNSCKPCFGAKMLSTRVSMLTATSARGHTRCESTPPWSPLSHTTRRNVGLSGSSDSCRSTPLHSP